jgi:uncharacterized protein (TIGR03663 family)
MADTLRNRYTSQTIEKTSPFKSALVAVWLNRETVAWMLIIFLAAATRLADLGPRALHQDEATHAGTFTRNMYLGGQVYQYDPTFHGPFLYYMVSLSFFLFGDSNDTTARIPPAVFGIGIVALCWALRPLIGKAGALFAAIFTLISPSILYYSRNLRHDAYAVFGELLFAIAVFRFFRDRQARWLTFAGLGLVITYASHELVFLNTAILVAWLVLAFAFELVALPSKIRRDKPVATNAPDEIEIEKPVPETEQIESELELNETTTPYGWRGALLWQILLFIIFAGLVSWGSTRLFTVEQLTSEVPKLFSNPETGDGGIPLWTVAMPLGYLLALLAAFLLGWGFWLAWKGLERTPRLIAMAVAVITFVGVGGFLSYRALNPKPSEEEVGLASTAPVTTTSPGLQVVVLPLVGAFLLALFVGPLIGWLWQRRFLFYTRKGLLGFAITFGGVWAISALVSLRFIYNSPAQGNVKPKGGLFIIGPEVDKWLAYIFNGFFLALALGLVAGWLVSLAYTIPDEKLRGSAALRGVLRIFRSPLGLAGFFGSFAVVYILLFGNFFFYAQGLADGIYRGVEYWAGVHGTRRLDQPWFYYSLLMLLYETLPFILATIAIVVFPVGWVWRAIRKGRFVFSTRGLFAGYCAWWSLLAMIAYSIAGEKVPWLNMQVALPAILAAAVLFDNTARRIHWREFFQPLKGPLFTGLFLLMFIAIAVGIGFLSNLTGNLPDQSSNLPSGNLALNGNGILLPRLIGGAVALLAAVALFGVSVWLWRRGYISGRYMRAVLLFVFTGALGLYGLKATLMLNYNFPVTNVEPMIQVQTTPELLNFVQRVDKLSRDHRELWKPVIPAGQKIVADPTGSKSMPVLLSQNVAPPLTWYFRKYTSINYFTPNNDSNVNSDAAPPKDSRGISYAIIAMDRSEDQFKIQQQMQDTGYTRMLFRRYWWFPEDDNGYLGIGKAPPDSTNVWLDKKKIQYTDWGKLWDTFTKQPSANLMWRYILYRELNQSLQSYDMIVYVRNDLAPDFMLLGGINYSGPKSGSGSTTEEGGVKLGDSTQAGLKNGQFKVPRTVAFAPNGDILVLDSGNGRVQRFAADGTYLSKFGKIGTTDGLLNIIQYDGGAGGLATDEEGNIYVSDSWNYRVQKFDSQGNFLLKFGEPFDAKGELSLASTRPNGFYGPRGIFYDRTKGELYLADTGNRRVAVFDKNGNFLRQFGGRGSGPGQFDEPVALAVSPNGNVYVTDLRNKRVQLLDRDGKYISEVKVPSWRDQNLNEPYVTLDSTGKVYVSDPANAKILVFSPDLSPLQPIESGAGVILENPVGMAVSPDGFLYVADAKRHTVAKIKLS